MKDPHTCIVKELQFFLLDERFQISSLLLSALEMHWQVPLLFFFFLSLAASLLNLVAGCIFAPPATLEEQNEQSNCSRV